MADVFTKDQRSQIMRQVKSSRNKSTEIRLIQLFKELSIKGWRRNYKTFGKPDFVFTKKKTAILIDGCFWHGHNCRNTKPKDNQEYWTQKINRNIQRDNIVNEQLTKKGWTVIRLWECELKNREILIERLKLNST
jgi:DNA mismatch endonuclease (patch repair protein)